MMRALLAALALTLTTVRVAASPVFVVTEPWVRPAAKGAETQAYMELRSSEAVTLVAVRSAAARAEVRDRRNHVLASLDLPPQALVRLAADGPRVRIGPLARTLRQGDRVPLTLVIRTADGSEQAIDVDAEVRLHSPSHDHHVPHTH